MSRSPNYLSEQFSTHPVFVGFESTYIKHPALYKTSLWLLLLVTWAAYFGWYIFLISCFATLLIWAGTYSELALGNLHLSTIYFPLSIVAWVGFSFFVLKSLWAYPNRKRTKANEKGKESFPFELPLDNIQRNFNSSITVTEEYGIDVKLTPILNFLPSKRHIQIGFPCLLGLSTTDIQIIAQVMLGPLRPKAWLANRLIDAMVSLQGMKNYPGVLGWFNRKFGRSFAFLFFILSAPYLKERTIQNIENTAFLQGKDAIADAFFKFNIHHMYLATTFWDTFFKSSFQVSEPSISDTTPYSSIQKDLQTISDREAIRWLNRTLLETPWQTFFNIHAADLVLFLDLEIDVPDKTTPSALEACFEDTERLIERIDAHWQQGAEDLWKDEFSSYQKQMKDIELLESEPNKTFKQKADLAHLYHMAYGSKQAFPKFKKLCDEHPHEPRAWFETGKLHLKHLEKQGLDYLQRAMELQPFIGEKCLVLMRNFFLETGQKQAAASILDQLNTHQNLIEEAHKERTTLTKNDAFSPHNLPAETTHTLQQLFQEFPDVERVHFVKKNMAIFSQLPGYVTCIEGNMVSIEKIQNSNLLPSSTIIVTDAAYKPTFLKKIELIKHAVIYDKGQRKPLKTEPRSNDFSEFTE